MVVVGLVLPVVLKNGKLATIRRILRSFGVNIITVIWIRKIKDHLDIMDKNFLFNI